MVVPSEVHHVSAKVLRGIHGLYSNERAKWTVLFALKGVALANLLVGIQRGNPASPWHDAKYAPVYNYFKSPTFQNFRLMWASFAEDPVMDFALTGLFVTMPLPGLSDSVNHRIEMLLAKFGIYNLLTALIVGKPSYTDAVHASGVKTLGEGVAKLAVVGGLIAGLGIAVRMQSTGQQFTKPQISTLMRAHAKRVGKISLPILVPIIGLVAGAHMFATKTLGKDETIAAALGTAIGLPLAVYALKGRKKGPRPSLVTSSSASVSGGLSGFEMTV
jgi:hypothetical protein